MISLHTLAPIFNHKWILHMMGDELSGAYWAQCGPHCNYTGITKNIIKRNKNGTDFSKGYNKRVRRAFNKHGVTNFMFISCNMLSAFVIEGFVLEVFEELKLNGDKTIANQKFSFGMGGITHGSDKAHYEASAAGGGFEAKPFEARNALTHELVASFNSTYDDLISTFFEVINTRNQVKDYLLD